MTILKNKKYYGYFKKNKKDILLVLGILFIGFIFCYLLHFLVDIKQNKDIYAAIICIFSTVYYCILYKDICNMRTDNNYINCNSKKCLNNFRSCVLFLSIFSILVMIISVIVNLNEYLNLILLIYTLLIGLGLMNFSLIVFFENEFYYSSGFKISYKEIDKIIKVGQVSTLDGILVLCRLEHDEKIIGYEKFMLNDYIYLKEIIDSNSAYQIRE